MHLEKYFGKLVFIRVIDKRYAEAYGLPAELFLAKVLALDETGIWIEWNRYPLVNRETGEKKFFMGELLIPHANVAAIFASQDFQRDVEAQAEAHRLANVPPAGEG